MVILTDLSEVLISGLFGIDNIITEHYNKDATKAFWARRLETDEEFRELLRGKMSEDEYWRLFAEKCKWPFNIQALKMFFSKNMRKNITGTLDVYKRIIAFPYSLPSRVMVEGIPEIALVSDHIRERIGEIHICHPDIFEMISRQFWSCESGKLKADEGFFPQLLRVLDIPPEEAILVDDSPYNTTAAIEAGITSICFTSAFQLETELREYGFCFVPAK